ncbi:tetratricopeptide repeat protein [Gracilimonas sp. Q87]|uniref:O-linked N-acetylglucosamine transferase, SPINDLY family protein n=1 Tax=Gracilimonas sp. Q87 TaxID=3384766 RepID=UPI00398422C5
MNVELYKAKQILNQNNGNTESALKILAGLIEKNGQTDEVLQLMIRGFIAKSDLQSASNVISALRNRGLNDAELDYYEAVCYSEKGEQANAEHYATSCLKKDGSHTDAWILLAEIYKERGKFNEALQFYGKANHHAPSNSEIPLKIGEIYFQQGFLDKSVEMFNIAIRLNSKCIEAYRKKAEALMELVKYEEAKETLYKALDISPTNIALHNLIGSVYVKIGRFGKALNYFETQLEKFPNEHSFFANIANHLVSVGQYERAEEYYRKVLSFKPDEKLVHSNMLMSMHYNPTKSKEEIYREHLEWDTLHSLKESINRPVPLNMSEEKKLRIGFISAGFFTHPVGWMITDGLKHLNKDDFELFFYYCTKRVDFITNQLFEISDDWKFVGEQSDSDIAQTIRNDEIDILVELSGHSGGGKLTVVSHKPAPITVKWVGGLFNTTGLADMDFLITDSIESPGGEEEYYTEKLIRMPDDYISYLPPDYAPEVSELPLKNNGYITFGCFNNPKKINEVILGKWCQILKEIPKSKLFLKGQQYDADKVRERVLNVFKENDIAVNRILFESVSPHNQLLEKYNDVDIALDPWPYSGGLTTCEALWMGVPVITKPGPTFAGRHSATHVNNAGYPQWVSESWEEYVETAVSLASDLNRLAEIRSELREVVASSPVCNGKRFAENLSKAFREIWRQRVRSFEEGSPSEDWCDHIDIKTLS